MDISETEMRAVEIVYERENGQKLAFTEIPDDAIEPILRQIRERALRIEQFVTHDMLVSKIAEGRRTPRRHMIAAFGAGLIMLVVTLIVLGVYQLFGGR